MRDSLQHWGIGRMTVSVDGLLRVIPSNNLYSLMSVGRRVRENGAVGRKTFGRSHPQAFDGLTGDLGDEIEVLVQREHGQSG